MIGDEMGNRAAKVAVKATNERTTRRLEEPIENKLFLPCINDAGW